MHALFRGWYGYAHALREIDPQRARELDRELDQDFARSGGAARLDALAAQASERSVLLFVPADPRRPYDLKPLAGAVRASRHRVRLQVDAADRPRSAKINAAALAVGDIDWLIVIDDDVALCDGFVDRFVGACEAAELMLAQPAHRIHSHATYTVTQRQARSIVRATGFVEVGPLLAVNRALFDAVLPLPETRWGWGADIVWADRAAKLGWRIGIVDGTPIEHLRPVNRAIIPAAMDEAGAMLRANGPITIGRVEMLAPGRVVL